MNTTVNEASERYTTVAYRCAETMLRGYSTSFTLACRLLDPATRPHVSAVYAWARTADEIVDGAFVPDGLDAAGRTAEARRLLDELRRRTEVAIERGHDPDPVTHAFADTAVRYGIDSRLIDPFYESMEMDLDVTEHTRQSLDRYIHGSAEVIGEMCLRTFAGGVLRHDEEAAAGARALGAAFQKVNFLRDVREDWHDLGRNYLPGRDPGALSERDLRELADDVDRDLAVARRAVDRIPGRDRAAVLAAHDLFAALNARLRAAGAAGVSAGRVRVPNRVKLAIAARAVASGRGRA